MDTFRKIIFYLFVVLLFFVPLVLWPYTSEVFEFNKMVLTYIITILIAAAWLTKCIVERKFIFRRTILDIPLLVFFGSQLISTVISIDFYTSLFGYYSRFNGGLLSTICYLVLYWAFVSNLDKRDAMKLIKVWFASAFLVSGYAVAEHFGIDKSIWVQDVQSRVFSSLGQPNWLASWVVALIPIAWALALKSKIKSANFWVYFGLSILFFWVLIYTKSRSGFLAFGIACIIFWGAIAWRNIKNIKNVSNLIPPLFLIGFAFVVICLLSGTQWTPSIGQFISHKKVVQVVDTSDTALETGGTESGVIRQIVWTGAVQIWLHYPVFGTGVETFAYSYYLYRPAAHNLTSEWDFIYNKAHNEFLNFAANSGTVGLLTYLVLIAFSCYIILKNPGSSKILKSALYKNKGSESAKVSLNFSGREEGQEFLRFGLFAGYISLSVCNFFGFSVVPTQLQFFLFPALAVVCSTQNIEWKKENKINTIQKISVFCILLATCYLLVVIRNYWYADILYNRGKSYNSVSRPDLAIQPLTQAINLEPYQSIYYGEVANSYAEVAMAYNQNKDATQAGELTDLAANSIEQAVNIAPANINLRRTMFGVYIMLSTIDQKYLATARNSLADAIKMAPTDPKLEYNLGIADANLGNFQAADADFQRAIELKSNYSDARIEYAALLAHLGKNDEAKAQLNYVLTNIDPTNTTAKQDLENLK
jgi:putative inorganic carbon (HCO3(-)) transporter